MSRANEKTNYIRTLCINDSERSWAKHSGKKGSVVRLTRVLLFLSSLFINLFNKSGVDERWETSIQDSQNHRKEVKRTKKERPSVIFELIRYLLLSRRRNHWHTNDSTEPNGNRSTIRKKRWLIIYWNSIRQPIRRNWIDSDSCKRQSSHNNALDEFIVRYLRMTRLHSRRFSCFHFYLRSDDRWLSLTIGHEMISIQCTEYLSLFVWNHCATSINRGGITTELRSERPGVNFMPFFLFWFQLIRSESPGDRQSFNCFCFFSQLTCKIDWSSSRAYRRPVVSIPTSLLRHLDLSDGDRIFVFLSLSLCEQRAIEWLDPSLVDEMLIY